MSAFEPMPQRLRDRLREVAGDAPAGSWLRLAQADSRDSELEALGMLEGVRHYVSGGGMAVLTSRGASYEADLAAWEAECDQARAARAWEASQARAEEFERDDRARRHDWHINLVNGAYAVGGSVVTLLIQWMLGC